MNKLYKIQIINKGGGGITTLVDKQFKIGDLVEYDNKEWEVTSIELFDFKKDIKLVERKTNWFTPKKDEVYYYVESGFVYEYDNFDKTDERMLYSTKLFRTKEEAQKELAKIQATIRIKKRIAELNEGWLPNWNNKTIGKYFIEYYYREAKLSIGRYTQYKHTDNDLYLESETLAKQLIEEMESDLKLMLEVE